jgi:hypothetical protein
MGKEWSPRTRTRPVGALMGFLRVRNHSGERPAVRGRGPPSFPLDPLYTLRGPAPGETR